jgi:hypothetical protein
LQRSSDASIQPDGNHGVDALATKDVTAINAFQYYHLHAIVLKMVEALSPVRRLPAYAKNAYESVADNLNPEARSPTRVECWPRLLWNGRPVNLAAGTSCCGHDHHPLPLYAFILEEYHRMLYYYSAFPNYAETGQLYSSTASPHTQLYCDQISTRSIAHQTLALTCLSASAFADQRACLDCFLTQTLVQFDRVRIHHRALGSSHVRERQPAEKYVLARTTPDISPT